MTGRIDARLAELGIDLPTPPTPAASYVPSVAAGGLLYVSGQVPFDASGALIIGKLGADMDVEGGQAAARACALSLISQVKAACGGDLDKLRRVVKLTGFVNGTAEFGDQPKVINGCSDVMVEVFGPEIGSHARSAVGMGSLPFGVAVEVEGIFDIG
ncbi:MAG: RidA family protein [Pseudomonadota bacterium]